MSVVDVDPGLPFKTRKIRVRLGFTFVGFPCFNIGRFRVPPFAVSSCGLWSYGPDVSLRTRIRLFTHSLFHFPRSFLSVILLYLMGLQSKPSPLSYLLEIAAPQSIFNDWEAPSPLSFISSKLLRHSIFNDWTMVQFGRFRIKLCALIFNLL